MSQNPMITDAAGSRPVPDPTAVTTLNIDKAVDCLREILEARFDGIDDLIALMQANLLRRHEDITEAVAHLERLHEEKFDSVQKQFVERDKRAEQTSTDSKQAVATASQAAKEAVTAAFQASKEAVAAALQAAKEAVAEQNKSSASAIAKSEAATMKQMDQMGENSKNTNKATDDKIDDLKTRLGAIDARTMGGKEAWADGKTLLLALVSLVMAGVGVASYVGSRSPGPEPKWTVPQPAPAPVPPQIIVVPAVPAK